MGKTPNEKIADKLIALFSDSRIGIVDWQHYIPFYITQQNYQIIANAKNLADGINEQLADNEIGLSREQLGK
jgi:hypothetical protein